MVSGGDGDQQQQQQQQQGSAWWQTVVLSTSSVTVLVLVVAIAVVGVRKLRWSSTATAGAVYKPVHRTRCSLMDREVMGLIRSTSGSLLLIIIIIIVVTVVAWSVRAVASLMGRCVHD